MLPPSLLHCSQMILFFFSTDEGGKNQLVRFIFLESIAGVPGMVAGMLRHLRSLRALKRDNGWIETLLEESYNERMHLLTFLKMCEPGWLMKVLIMGAQGVYFVSPNLPNLPLRAGRREERYRKK